MPPSPNFVVSSLIMIEFGVLIEFDQFSLPNYDVILCLRLLYPFEISKFFISGRIWLTFGSGDKF